MKVHHAITSSLVILIWSYSELIFFLRRNQEKFSKLLSAEDGKFMFGNQDHLQSIRWKEMKLILCRNWLCPLVSGLYNSSCEKHTLYALKIWCIYIYVKRREFDYVLMFTFSFMIYYYLFRFMTLVPPTNEFLVCESTGTRVFSRHFRCQPASPLKDITGRYLYVKNHYEKRQRSFAECLVYPK